MPYIKNDNNVKEQIMNGRQLPQNVGELNYFVTAQCLKWLASQRVNPFGGSRKTNYNQFNYVIGRLVEVENTFVEYALTVDNNIPRQFLDIHKTIRAYMNKRIEVMEPVDEIYTDVRGVLRCAQLEMYRRMIAAYEDEKIKEKGDVYPVDGSAVLWSAYEPKVTRG